MEIVCHIYAMVDNSYPQKIAPIKTQIFEAKQEIKQVKHFSQTVFIS